MPLRRFFVLFSVLGVFVAIRAPADEAAPTESREVENLATFARVYGYVRFFYPSDEAATLDWDRLGAIGAEEARGAVSAEALRLALLRVFQPIAPQLELSTTDIVPTQVPQATPGTRRDPVTFWQYVGIDVSNQAGAYQKRRVVLGADIKDRQPLFKPVVAPAQIAVLVGRDLFLTMPAALPVKRDGTTTNDRRGDFTALQNQLNAIDVTTLGPRDLRVRVAGVITVWNTFQHFHPYLDAAGIRWEESLRPALLRALRDASGADYYATLAEMIAQTGDGHGYVFREKVEIGSWPLRVRLIDGWIVVTGLEGDAPLRKGDIVQRVDGVDAVQVLRDRERYTAGSPHLRQFRALNQFGEGPGDRVSQIEVLRDGAARTVELKRQPGRHEYFFKSVPEFEFPGFAEIRPGICYVNLYTLSQEEYETRLPQLAAARGVIFDWRWDGRRTEPNRKRISVHSDIISRLIDKPVLVSPMLTPQITAPDRAGWTYRESTWPIAPKPPRLKGRIVFINEPSVVSYGETCMAVIASNRLATLVGDATAGCNGNASYIRLPGGFRVMWTAMDVRKHDHTSFYGVGFAPDVRVTRTLIAVKEGRDEYLEAAIAYLETAGRSERVGPQHATTALE